MKFRKIVLGGLSLCLSSAVALAYFELQGSSPQPEAQAKADFVSPHHQATPENLGVVSHKDTNRPNLASRNEALATRVTVAYNNPADIPSGGFQSSQSVHQPAMPVRQRPDISLGESSHGPKAFQLLKNSGKLKEFAAYYGWSQDEVKSLFDEDSSAYLDKTGALNYVESAAGIGEISSLPDSGPSVALYPLDQTFQLESKPNSPRTIYLDFVGATTTNTAWNSSYGITQINSPAFDLDGNPGTFNSTELTRIQNIWRRVVEDYAPFDVNVTTKAPDPSKLTRTDSADNEFGVTVVITKDFTSTVNKSCSCGGFAYLGVFDSASDMFKPAFVFYNRLGSNEKAIAEAISHEVGHTVGLRHDGTSTAAYYRGQGSGATGWAPIMGVGYYKQLTQWSKGEYADANNTEDDYQVMQSNSLFFDKDDYADTIGKATAAKMDTVNGYAQAAWQGVLQGPNDIDVVAINAGAGAATIDATPFIRSPNVDLLIKLFDQNGKLLATANPVDALNASISTDLPSSGTYYVSVEGTGKGDPLVDGYTDYGSIGIYNIKVKAQVPTSTPVAPKAVAEASTTSGKAPLSVDFSAAKSFDANNDIVSYNWNFGDGTSGTGVTASHEYTQGGTYTATLTVTDATNLSGTDSVDISVAQDKTIPSASVGNILMKGVVKHRRHALHHFARALVFVQDSNGNCLPNARVSITWSGAVSSTQQAYSSCSKPRRRHRMTSPGAAFTSPSSSSPGDFTISVNNIELNGYQFKPGASDQQSITVQ